MTRVSLLVESGRPDGSAPNWPALRRLLKRLLRDGGWRCIDAREVRGETGHDPHPGPAIQPGARKDAP